jgi:MoaA/NifB/PqqE/SkfB family radical SAM enzyme
MTKTFCPLPFTHLYIKPNGEYQPCCRFKGVNQTSKIHEHKSLDTLLNSSELLSGIREGMLNGEKIKGCESCYLEEEAGGESMRTGEIERWGGYEELHDKTPTVNNIEITFGNYCNLACRTCGSNLSTSWQKDDEILSKVYNRSFEHMRQNVKKDWVPEDFKNVEKFKITGGEPMLHPDFLSFLDDIIQSGSAKNIEVQIFTNTSFVPKRHLLDRLSRFKEMGIWLSIDGTGDVQEYVRHNSKWDIVEESTRAWLEFENQFKDVVRVNFAPTISLYNIFNLREMLDWFTNLRKDILEDSKSFSNCTWNITTWPHFLDIKHLPEKQKILHQLKKYSSTFTDESLENYKELVDRVVERLLINGDKNAIIEFTQFNKDLDKLRNQKFIETFPELYEQIKDVWDNTGGKLDK